MFQKTGIWGIFFDPKFFSKMTLLWLILCEESIARIPEAWRRFVDSDSGNKFVLKRKYEKFGFFFWKSSFLGLFYARNRLRAFLNPENASKITPRKSSQIKKTIFELNALIFPWIRVKEAFSRFGNVRNRFSHDFTPNRMIFRKF